MFIWVYSQVFRDEHKVYNVVNIGIKDIFKQQKKLPPVSLNLGSLFQGSNSELTCHLLVSLKLLDPHKVMLY